MLTLIAFYAPAGRQATWFALTTAFTTLAVTAGQLQTKYLNQLFTVTRGNYNDLGLLMVTVAALTCLIPVAVILAVGRRV